jgi:hypothetical protein
VTTEQKPEKPARRKLASSPQLYAINKVGRLSDVIEADGKVYSDRAWDALAALAEQGLWKPKHNRDEWESIRQKARGKTPPPVPADDDGEPVAEVASLDGLEYVELKEAAA